MLRKSVFVVFLLAFAVNSVSQPIRKIQALLDSLREAGNFPGLSVSIIKNNAAPIVLVSGYNDKEKNIVLATTDRMLHGSVGKTYASAIALQLVQTGKLNLDEKVSAYLGHHQWYKRIPNTNEITVRMLMNHTSGVMRYEFKDQFLKDLTANPARIWTPEELLHYVLDEKASFAAGEGWDYSDTNYILLGMIIEKITGEKYNDILVRDILQKYKLEETLPSDHRTLKGLAQGYAGETNEFGGKEKMISDDGLFIINPQFEWTGGGVYSSTADLAKWGHLLYGGKIIDTTLLLSSAVPAKLGKDVKYALGVIIRHTPSGMTYGHSGFFPGYMTELVYFPGHRMTLALQCNSSDFKNLKISLAKCVAEIANVAKTL